MPSQWFSSIVMNGCQSKPVVFASAIHSCNFVAAACVYLLLASQFLAMLQVLVYAGAIMVLFLFVIMLLGIDKQSEPGPSAGLGRMVLVISLALVLVTLFGKIAVTTTRPGTQAALTASAPAAVDGAVEDSVHWLATALLEKHLVSFELASLVLIAAMAGALVFTTKRGPATSEPEATAPGGGR